MSLKWRLLAGITASICTVLIASIGADVQAQQTAPAKSAQKKAPPAPVVTAAIQNHRLSSSIQLTGSVTAVRTTQAAAPVAGLVVELMVRDGDHVKAGQALGRLSTEALEARRLTLEAQLHESEARLRGAEVKVKRAHELLDAGVIATEQFDDLQFDFEALDARMASLKAQIGEIDLGIRQSMIYAPFGGDVSSKLTEVGQWARVGDPLFEIVATDELEVSVAVPEVHFQKIRLQQAAEITFESLPGAKLRGIVSSLAPAADPEARTFPVKLSVSSRNGQVRPGMVAEVGFAPANPRDVLIAPKDALVEQDEGWVVFVAKADNTVKRTPVKVGDSVEAWSEVSGDVVAGDQVVILGNERLQDGRNVSVQSRDLPKP